MTYTEQQIRSRHPGRELDALVAKAMGWTNFSPIDPNCDHAVGVDGYRRNFALDPSDGKQKPFPLYSTDISAAWEVVEKLGIALIPQSKEDGFRWYACDIESVSYRGSEVAVRERNQSSISAETAPEAICKAALLAIGGAER